MRRNSQMSQGTGKSFFSTAENERNLQQALRHLRVEQPSVTGQYPVIFHLDVTGRCNLSCLYCQRDFFVKTKHPFLKGDLSEEVFAKLVPYFRHAKVVALLSMLGEPLVVKALPQWWTAIVEAGAKPQTTTNGTFLTEALADLFVATGGRLKLSIDTLVQPTLQVLRPKLETELLIDRLQLLGRLQRTHDNAGFQLGINTVATAINLAQVVKTWEECLRHARVDVFTLASFRMPRDERGTYHRDAESLTLDAASDENRRHWHEILRWARARREQDGIQFIFPFSRAEWTRILGEGPLPIDEFDESDRDSQSGSDGGYYCCVPWLKVGVLADGTVIPCHLLYWPAPEVSFGSLADTDFDSIWNGPAYREFRRKMAAREDLGPCATCRSWWRHHSPQRIE